MENNHKVSLGCGTLILIALIVLIFSNTGNDDLRKETQQIKQQISNLEQSMHRLESAIDRQSKQLADLQRAQRQETTDKAQ